MLDVRTIAIIFFINSSVATLFMAALWQQSRKQFPGISLWLTSFALLTAGFVLVSLRNVIPDAASILTANICFVAAAFILYLGLERFVACPSSQRHNYIILAVFAGLFTYFTFFQPDVAIRIVLLNVTFVLMFLQSSWLMLHRVGSQLKPLTRATGIVCLMFAVAACYRIILVFFMPAPSNYLNVNLWDSIGLLINQIITIGMVLVLILMVNRRMLLNILNQDEILLRSKVELEISNRDLIQHKQVEDALRESELRYRDLVNFSKNGVAVYVAAADGEDFIIKDFNQAAESIENVKKEDIIGKSILQIFPGVKEFGLFEVLQRVWRTGVPEHHPLRWYHDERISGWRDSYVYRLPSGEIVAIYEDVTERKQAEVGLQKSGNLLNRIIDQSPISMWISDEKGTLIRINRACCELLNITEKEVLGKYNIFQDNIVEKQGFMPQVKSVFEEGKTVRFELRYDTTELKSLELESQAFVVLDITIFPVIDTDGHIINSMIHQINITDRKQAEENLEKSRQGLRSLSMHLLSLMEEERTLLAREIHDDLGQSLTALQIDLAWLTKKITAGPLQLGEKIKSMSKLLKEMDNKVKKISRSLRPPMLDDLGLAAAVQDYAKEYEDRTGIRCSLSIDPPELNPGTDIATTVFRILQEALTNVIRHAAARRVVISIQIQAGNLVMEITDDGSGIREKEITDSKSLGLIGMKERAALLGGKLEIKALKGKGTMLNLLLPLKG